MNMRACTAEFVGTFALIFVGVLVGHHLGGVPAGLIGVAIGHGLAIACLASATGAISGGHLNPAVTVAMAATKRIDPVGAITYIIAQLLGAAAAAYMASFILGPDGAAAIQGGTPALASGVSMGAGFVAEVIATFFLIFVIFGTAVDSRAPKVGAWFIGMTVTMGIFAIGPLTGGALNPARWFGPAMINKNFADVLLYFGGPIVGALVAAFLYEFLMTNPDADLA
jgi:hypothetical protein